MAVFETKNPCFECDRKFGIFKLLNDFELEILSKNRYEVKFKPGEVILKQGTAITHVLALTDGLAKIYLEGYNKNDIIIKIQKPREVIAGCGIYVDMRHKFSISALTHCDTCMIDVNVFKELIRSNNAFMEAYFTEFSARNIFIYNKFLSLTQKQMHGRIADALINLSEQVFESLSFDMIMTRQELGEMTAMTRESASRILQLFKNEGIIRVKGNNVEILNMDQLKSISATG